MRGVRGATTVTENTVDAILTATEELLRVMIESNGIDPEFVASVLFTTTPDLTATYPARAARQLGWTQTPLMGFQEIHVPDGMCLCIRVLIHWNTEKRQDEIVHVYLREAVQLRPDVVESRAKGVKK